jgi:hypothetical protein
MSSVPASRAESDDRRDAWEMGRESKWSDMVQIQVELPQRSVCWRWCCRCRCPQLFIGTLTGGSSTLQKLLSKLSLSQATGPSALCHVRFKTGVPCSQNVPDIYVLAFSVPKRIVQYTEHVQFKREWPPRRRRSWKQLAASTPAFISSTFVDPVLAPTADATVVRGGLTISRRTHADIQMQRALGRG